MTLVSAYSFDAGAVTDVVSGHNGTLFGTPTFPSGHSGLGLQCASASSQYVEVDDHADFAFGASWTVMLWFKPTSLVVGELVCKPNQWWFSTNASGQATAGFYYSGGGSSLGIASDIATAMTAGTWHHWAFRFNGTDYSIVQNGVESNFGNDATGKSMNDSTDKMRMGSWDGSSEFQNGVFDDVRIYKGEWLTESAIQALMNTPVGGQTLLPDNGLAGSEAGNGWSTTPLWSKLNDANDATYITATSA